jgi:thiol:disulfide interchange protein DsbD
MIGIPAKAEGRFKKPAVEVVDPASGRFKTLTDIPPAPAKDDSRDIKPKGTAPGAGPKATVPAPTRADATTLTAETDLLTFIGLGIFWGALSLVTPCVFPMIPITVSFFIKQSEVKNRSPLVLALIYSGTIAGVLTFAGIFLIQVLQPFSQHWLTNFALGVLFIVFALSLFGMYEIVLPARLVNLTSAQEGRGGVAGTMFMALTFTIISFTCVAPFYGWFLGVTSSSQGGAWWSNPAIMVRLALGALAYSITFASPFFFLALFPTLMRVLPKSGSWMNTVKVVMGFLELAAAIKLLRAAELSLTGKADYLTYDIGLGLYIAMSFACGLYLLNLYRLPHDHGASESLGVPRLLCSLAFLALGFYLMPGLFKHADGERQRPAGVVYNWVEAFLLRDEEPPEVAAVGPGGTVGSRKKEVWLGNLNQALDQAEKERKLVFIDFTGVNCSNCKFNEGSVFPRPDIRALFNEYVLLKLYCDTVPPWYQPTTSGSENERFRDEVFHKEQLPLYAIVKPTGDGMFETIGVYDEGKINFPDKFAEFLRQPLQK